MQPGNTGETSENVSVLFCCCAVANDLFVECIV